MAKVHALREHMDSLDRRRDYFVAHSISVQLNSMRTKEDDPTISTEDILGAYYKSKSVVTTEEEIPAGVMGAMGNLGSLRTSMIRGKNG